MLRMICHMDMMDMIDIIGPDSTDRDISLVQPVTLTQLHPSTRYKFPTSASGFCIRLFFFFSLTLKFCTASLQCVQASRWTSTYCFRLKIRHAKPLLHRQKPREESQGNLGRRDCQTLMDRPRHTSPVRPFRHRRLHIAR